jgi:hypothetical protein
VGTAAPALAATVGLVLALALNGRAAHADPCTGISSEGGRFAACFDPGNRLSVTGGNEGFGGGIAIRNTIDFEDEPDLVWKMSHDVADVTRSFDDSELSALIYRGVFLRHSRDGHIVLPIGETPKNIFLPFDIGALVEVGQLRWVRTGSSDLEVVRTAMLVDLARTRDFRTRLAIGPVASWDITFDDSKAIAVTDQRVAPFSSLLVDCHLESHSGLTFGDLRVDGGYAWHTTTSWAPRMRAEADFERVVIAINDRPVALYANALYDSDTKEAIAGIGVRVVLVQRRDPRVSLNPPSVAMAAR